MLKGGQMFKDKAKTDYQREYMRKRRLARKSASQDAPQLMNPVRPDELDPSHQPVLVRPNNLGFTTPFTSDGNPSPPTKPDMLPIRTLSPHRSMSIPGIVADGVVPFCRLSQR